MAGLAEFARQWILADSMPCRSVLLGLALASHLLAQVPTDAANDAAKRRVVQALQRAATQVDTGFEATWGEDNPAKAGPNPAPNPLQMAMTARLSGATKGSWHQGLRHVIYTGDEGDQLLVTPQGLLARDQQRPWTPRNHRFADGNPIPFVPAPERLLQFLATTDLAVTHTEVGALDDHPVQTVTFTLNADQASELLWQGLVPPTLLSASLGDLPFNLRGRQGPRNPATPVAATVDLAVTIDPATGDIRRLHLRAWNPANAGAGQGFVVFQAGGQVIAGQGQAEAEAADEPDPNAPLTWQDGLPVRPRAKMVVRDYVVRLQDQGTAKPPELPAQAAPPGGR